MEIELKRISFNARLSQETNAFAADIWIDGTKAGTAENSGHGGPTNIWINSPELAAQAEAFAKSLPPIDMSKYNVAPLPMNLELYIDELLESHIQKKSEDQQFKRWCKKSLVFRLKSDKPGEWRTLKSGYTSASAKFIRDKYGDAIEEILNERFQRAA